MVGTAHPKLLGESASTSEVTDALAALDQLSAGIDQARHELVQRVQAQAPAISDAEVEQQSLEARSGLEEAASASIAGAASDVIRGIG